MPFFGRFDHFRDAVASVLSQTDPDWRLIIVDDCYPDPEPGQWAASISDDRVSYRRNDTNLGVSGNFAYGATLMASEFGVLAGCDDLLLPNFVQNVRQLLQAHPDVSFVQPGVRVIDEHGRPVKPLSDRVKALYRGGATGTRELEGQPLAASLVRGNWAYFPSVVWRADVIRDIGFRQDLNVVQDLAMMLEITRRGGTMLVDDEVVFEYRRHSSSVSAVGGPDGSKFREERALFSQVAGQFRDAGWSRAARAADWHLSSRLHALTDLPVALRRSDSIAVRTLVSHVMGTRYP
ncbi:MAG: glycosyltransferase family 2 protein [Salinibacterium sp.]|nr:glycosyltransferase family 2 protein [Salinibacterium sp.]